MRHRRGVIAGSALAIAALALTAFPASADPAGSADRSPSLSEAVESAVSGPAPGAPAEMLRAMQRDLDLSPAQAKARVANEHLARKSEPVFRAELGESFAGSWTTGATSKLVVATTDRAEASAIEAAGARAEVVPHSMAELAAAKNALDRAAKRSSTDAAPVWYADVRTNRVVVHSPEPAAVAGFVDASGADPDLIRVVESAEQPRPLYDLRGGDAYYIGGGRCSIGFPVTSGSAEGFVTAGHCGDTGDSTSGHNRVSQGTFQGSVFPGSDYAWVQTNSNWTATPFVSGSGGADVQVSGSTQAPVGSSICRSGSTTGWHCGTIEQHDTSVTYSQGTIYEVTRTTVCAEPGDSGGSYISGDQAQGVTSGGSGNCTSGGTTYYQPVNEILQAYGLTLKTEGGSGNPPSDCASTQYAHSGSLTNNGQAVEPDGSYYYSSSSGTHFGCLDGPSGTDFDLYLQQWSGSGWTTVAQGITPGADEQVEYSGSAGYYRYVVHAYSGSGSYALASDRP